MTTENKPPDNEMRATTEDIPVTNVNKMTVEKLTQAVLNAGAATDSGESGGTK